MDKIIMWASIGILLLALLIGFLVGLIRGVKRSGTHIAFLVVSFVVSLLLTQTIAKAILKITLPFDNGKYTVSDYIIQVISKKFDISAFSSASTFVANIPKAIVSPILFIFLSMVVYFLFNIAYLITARLVFGKKKVDFKENKPHRAFGGIIGIVEGLFVVIMMFGPLSSLTGTYKEIAHASSISTEVKKGEMKTISQYAHDFMPDTVDKIVLSWDKSVCGKLPKVFGLNNFLFDQLSSFKVNGEKIYFRKEISNLAYAYDDFVEVYNLAKREQYDKIYLGNLRSSLNYVLNGGVFKGVICGTIDTVVNDYKNMREKLPFTPPELMDDIVGELQKDKNFGAAKYLKNDIKSMIDVFDVVFTKDLISKYNAIDKEDYSQIIDLVNENTDAIGDIAKDILSLNIVDGSFHILIEKASVKVEKFFEKKDHEVTLNTNVTNKKQTIDKLLHIVDSIADLNKDIEISKILTADDKIEELTNIENISETMKKIGRVFDEVRTLDLLVVTPETEPGQEQGETIYMFDNILKNYGVELLGDEVYLNSDAKTKTTLDTYTKFFNFIAVPIDLAKEMGLTDLRKDDVVFDDVLDQILFSLKIYDTNVLTNVVMPFHELSVMDLRTLVFDEVVSQLKTNVDFLSLDTLVALDDYHAWAEEFDLLGDTLDKLNTGRKVADKPGEIEGYDNTYIKYLLSGDSDLEKVMKALLGNNRLSGILNNVFSARAFENLTRDIFDILDDKVAEMTGTKQISLPTDLTKLKATKTNTIATIEGVLNLVLSDDELSISDYGKILQYLKVNAANGGTKDGVFNNIFVRVIWYMTGDDLTETEKDGEPVPGVFAGLEAHENAKDIKAFLNTSDYYAADLDYAVEMAKVEKAVDLAKKIDDNVKFDGTAAEIVEDLNSALEEMTDEEIVQAAQNLKDLIKNKKDDLLKDFEGQKEDLGNAIEKEFEGRQDVIDALKDLLGL